MSDTTKKCQDGCGSSVNAISRDMVDILVKRAEESKQYRQERMPTEEDALLVMFDAVQRLKELGWKESMYAPEDGRPIKLIEAHSTGIHDGRCERRPSSEFPSKWFWIHDGDIWPSHPILFKDDKKAPGDELLEIPSFLRAYRDI